MAKPIKLAEKKYYIENPKENAFTGLSVDDDYFQQFQYTLHQFQPKIRLKKVSIPGTCVTYTARLDSFESTLLKAPEESRKVMPSHPGSLPINWMKHSERLTIFEVLENPEKSHYTGIKMP